MSGEEKPTPGVARIMKPYELEAEQYEKVSSILDNEFNLGLSRETNARAAIKMFPTYVRAVPDGSERGHVLALDLGGTNLRVLLITLDGTNIINSEFNKNQIPQDVMLGPGEKLFDFIATCVAGFLEERGMKSQRLILGFTFSFPVKQEGIAKGRLVTWTKGFECPGVEGEDVVRLLREAFQRRGDLNIDCLALINDTVGCLMSGAHQDHDCRIGVILGTGTNASYMEKLNRVGTWDGDHDDPNQVIINTEWGAFGDNGVLDYLRTREDSELDAGSINPGEHLYEKMISGMYLGELGRRIIERCASEGLMFGGRVSPELATPNKYDTKYISDVERDPENLAYKQTISVCKLMGYDAVSLDDCRNFHYICGTIGRRAARLSGTGIATLINRVDGAKITVAIDGSLYRFHPTFSTTMKETMDRLVEPGKKFKVVLADDGSGRGAALVAAVESRLHTAKK